MWYMNYSQIMSPRRPLPRKVGGHDPPPQLLWERRPWLQTCGPAAVKVLSPKLLRVRLTTSVRVSAERSCLARASATSWQSSARLPGALRRRCRTRTGRRQSQSWTRRAAAQEASAAGGAQARYDHIAWCLPRAWRQRSELTAGSS